MVGIVADEAFNLFQTLGKRLYVPPPLMIYEAVSSYPERSNLRPLLTVRLSRHLESAPHPMKRMAALGALRS